MLHCQNFVVCLQTFFTDCGRLLAISWVSLLRGLEIPYGNLILHTLHVQVETFGAMARTEKIAFILEQVRS